MTFQLIPEDLQALDAYLRRRGPWRMLNGVRTLVMAVAVCVLLWSIVTGLLRHRGGAFGADVLSSLLPIGLVVVFGVYYWRAVSRQQRGNPLLAQPQTVSLTRDTVRIETEDAQSAHKWSGVHEVVADERALYVFLEKDTAMVVPRRAFADPHHAQHFFDAAQALWKGQPAPSLADEQEIWPPPRSLKP